MDEIDPMISLSTEDDKSGRGTENLDLTAILHADGPEVFQVDQTYLPSKRLKWGTTFVFVICLGLFIVFGIIHKDAKSKRSAILEDYLKNPDRKCYRDLEHMDGDTTISKYSKYCRKDIERLYPQFDKTSVFIRTFIWLMFIFLIITMVLFCFITILWSSKSN